MSTNKLTPVQQAQAIALLRMTTRAHRPEFFFDSEKRRELLEAIDRFLVRVEPNGPEASEAIFRALKTKGLVAETTLGKKARAIKLTPRGRAALSGREVKS